MARVIMIEDRNANESIFMWGKIVEKYGDVSCLNKEFNEVWQYMGTVQKGMDWFHQFRHRAFPVTNERKLDNIPVSRSFKSTDWKVMTW